MIFDSAGNPVRLVLLIAHDPNAGFVVGAHTIDEPPLDEDLDEAVINLFCHQMAIEDDAAIEQVRRRFSSGTIQAMSAVLEPDEVLPLFEPSLDVSNIPLTEDDVGRMTPDELLEYRDLLMEQSQGYVPDPTALTHNAELLAGEIKRRLDDRNKEF